MRIDIITVLPEMIEGFFNCSIMKRAQNKGLAEEGPDLLIGYHMAFDEIVEVIPNTIDCAVQYSIVYTERFFGYA